MRPPPPPELSPAKKKLLAQMKEIREKLGPELLEKAASAIRADNRQAAAGKKPPPDNSVPYDKKAASRAIRLFLDNHKNAPAFEKKLIERLKSEDKRD